MIWFVMPEGDNIFRLEKAMHFHTFKGRLYFLVLSKIVHGW